MKEIQVDSRRKLCVFESSTDLIQALIDHFVLHAHEAINSKGSFCIALSGGSTPKAYLQELCKATAAKELDFSKIFIFWSDERDVPPDHPDSNYKMAMQFFQAAPFSNAHFFRMDADKPEEYEMLIKKHCPDARFDILYLGIGEDGHTASLFPDTDALSVQDKLVVSTFVQSKNTRRCTFTFPLINRAKQIIVLATGNSKALILQEILKPDADYPAARVGTDSSPALIFCDRLAAALCVS